MENTKELGFLAKLSPDDLKTLVHYVDRHMEESLRNNGVLDRLAVDSARSEAVNKALGEVMAVTGQSPEDSMLYALTLYEVAARAVGQGQRVVLLDDDYRFVREIRGLGMKTSEVAPEKIAAG